MARETLTEIFASLDTPKQAAVLSALPVRPASRFRVGKDSKGGAFLLYELPSKESAGSKVPAIRLRHLEYEPRIVAKVRESARGPMESCAFLMLRCHDADELLLTRFFDLAEGLLVQLGERPRFDEIDRSLRSLIELFRAMADPAKRSITGLWAELLLIHDARSLATTIAAWHSANTEHFDFVSGLEMVEVKSTTLPLREHDVALDQLAVPQGHTALLASLLLSSSDMGTSANDLIEGIRKRLARDTETFRRLVTIAGAAIGEDWALADTVRFDLDSARQSLRVFNAADIPAVEKKLPPEVRRVRFTVDLSGVAAIPLSDLPAGGLSAALWNKE